MLASEGKATKGARRRTSFGGCPPGTVTYHDTDSPSAAGTKRETEMHRVRNTARTLATYPSLALTKEPAPGGAGHKSAREDESLRGDLSVARGFLSSLYLPPPIPPLPHPLSPYPPPPTPHPPNPNDEPQILAYSNAVRWTRLAHEQPAHRRVLAGPRATSLPGLPSGRARFFFYLSARGHRRTHARVNHLRNDTRDSLADGGARLPSPPLRRSVETGPGRAGTGG